MTMVPAGVMPDEDISSSNCCFERMSRRTVSQSCEFQAQAMAPGTWPSSYALVSTSTSTMRTLASVAWASAQSVLTRVSGCAYANMGISSMNLLIVTSGGPGLWASQSCTKLNQLVRNCLLYT